MSLQGTEIVVELKNGCELRGILEECDANINLTMIDVKHISLKGEVKEMDTLFVNGTTIMYAHLASDLNVRVHTGNYVISAVLILKQFDFSSLIPQLITIPLSCTYVHIFIWKRNHHTRLHLEDSKAEKD